MMKNNIYIWNIIGRYKDYHQKENMSVKSVFMVFSSRKCLNVSSQIALKVTLRKIAGKRKKTDNTQKSKNMGP